MSDGKQTNMTKVEILGANRFEPSKKLYASFGFVENGDIVDDEIVTVLKL